MHELEDRVAKLEELKEKVIADGHPISVKSFTTILDYHTEALREIHSIIEMISKDDFKGLQNWYEGRK